MSLLRYGKQPIPVCRCGREGTWRCASCLKADDMAAEIKRRLTDRRLRKLKFGDAPADEDIFNGFREEK